MRVFRMESCSRISIVMFFEWIKDDDDLKDLLLSKRSNQSILLFLMMIRSDQTRIQWQEVKRRHGNQYEYPQMSKTRITDEWLLCAPFRKEKRRKVHSLENPPLLLLFTFSLLSPLFSFLILLCSAGFLVSCSCCTTATTSVTYKKEERVKERDK